MPHHVKIATCCYCGTRAALVLDRARHELTCSACGAPLHEMKMLPKQNSEGGKFGVQSQRGRGPRTNMATAKRQKPRESESYEARPTRKKIKTKRKTGVRLGRKLMEELWDVVEDVFD